MCPQSGWDCGSILGFLSWEMWGRVSQLFLGGVGEVLVWIWILRGEWA